MVSDPLHGRVALVTGGGRGIGRAISLAFAEDGADVAVNYRRNKDAADETVAAIEAIGRRAVAVPGSLEVLDEVQAVASTAIDALGPVDILVNNAGVASRGNSVADTDPDEVLRLLRTHAIGPHWLSAAVLPGDADPSTRRHRVHLVRRHPPVCGQRCALQHGQSPRWRRWRSRSRRKSGTTAST